MTQQTLREEFNEEFGYKDGWEFYDGYNAKEDGWDGASMVKSAGCDDCGKCQNSREAMRDFMLARFKEFAEKELIKENEEHARYCDYGDKYPCTCGARTRNALRNEQRATLKEFIK